MFKDVNFIERYRSVFLKIKGQFFNSFICGAWMGQEVLEGKFLEDKKLYNEY